MTPTRWSLVRPRATGDATTRRRRASTTSRFSRRFSRRERAGAPVAEVPLRRRGNTMTMRTTMWLMIVALGATGCATGELKASKGVALTIPAGDETQSSLHVGTWRVQWHDGVASIDGLPRKGALSMGSIRYQLGPQGHRVVMTSALQSRRTLTVGNAGI